MDFDKVLQLLRELHRHEVEYVLVGGVALNLLGLVRPTDDIDLFIRPTEENVARLKQALRAVWDDPAIEEIAAAELAGDIPVVRYGPPDDDLMTVDVIARIGTAFRYEDIEFDVSVYEDVPVRVATPLMLYRMKRDTIRSRDRGDAERLMEKFKFEDE
jgi:hypothetical protein